MQIQTHNPRFSVEGQLCLHKIQKMSRKVIWTRSQKIVVLLHVWICRIRKFFTRILFNLKQQLTCGKLRWWTGSRLSQVSFKVLTQTDIWSGVPKALAFLDFKSGMQELVSKTVVFPLIKAVSSSSTCSNIFRQRTYYHTSAIPSQGNLISPKISMESKTSSNCRWTRFRLAMKPPRLLKAH